MVELTVLAALFFLVVFACTDMESWPWRRVGRRPPPDVKGFWDRRELRGDEALESWRAAAALAGAALKSATLLNGAAAAAVFAYLGANREPPAKEIVDAMAFFLAGTFAAVVATGMGYLSAWLENRSIWRWIQSGDDFWCERGMYMFHAVAFVLVIGAYVCFAIGALAGHEALQDLVAPSLAKGQG